MDLDSKITSVAERVRATVAGAAGTHPASGEVKRVLTPAGWSQTRATGIREVFRSGLRWRDAASGAGARSPLASVFRIWVY